MPVGLICTANLLYLPWCLMHTSISLLHVLILQGSSPAGSATKGGSITPKLTPSLSLDSTASEVRKTPSQSTSPKPASEHLPVAPAVSPPTSTKSVGLPSPQNSVLAEDKPRQDVAPAPDLHLVKKPAARRCAKSRSLKCVAVARRSQTESSSDSESPSPSISTSRSSQQRSTRSKANAKSSEAGNERDVESASQRRLRGRRKATGTRARTLSSEDPSTDGEDSDSDFVPPTQTMRSRRQSSQSASQSLTTAKAKAAAGDQLSGSSSSSSDSEDFKPLKKKLRRSLSSPSHFASQSKVGASANSSPKGASPKLKSPNGSRRSSISRRTSIRDTPGEFSPQFWLVYCCDHIHFVFGHPGHGNVPL